MTTKTTTITMTWKRAVGSGREISTTAAAASEAAAATAASAAAAASAETRRRHRGVRKGNRKDRNYSWFHRNRFSIIRIGIKDAPRLPVSTVVSIDLETRIIWTTISTMPSHATTSTTTNTQCLPHPVKGVATAAN